MADRSSVVIAPDSFKGSLSAPDAAAAIAAGVARGWPGATTRVRPMADGGEGTLDAVLRATGAAATRGAIDVEGAGGATVQRGLRHRRSRRRADRGARGRAGRRDHRRPPACRCR
jgi:glycerate kinase